MDRQLQGANSVAAGISWMWAMSMECWRTSSAYAVLAAAGDPDALAAIEGLASELHALSRALDAESRD